MPPAPALLTQLPHKIFSIQDEPPRWGVDGEDVGMESLSEAGFDFEDGSTTLSRPSSLMQEAVRVEGGDAPESDQEDYGKIKESSSGGHTKQPLSVCTTATVVASSDLEDVSNSAMVESFATLGVSTPITPTRVLSSVAGHHRSRTERTALTVRGSEDDAEGKSADVGGSFHDITREAAGREATEHVTAPASGEGAD